MVITRSELDAGHIDFSDLVDPGTPAALPPHPGLILREDYLLPLRISAYALAKAIDVPPNRITGIIRGEREITADTALRLARFFGTDAQSWVNLQTSYDLALARREISERLAAIKPMAA